MARVVVGIDPGLGGALSRFEAGILTDIKDMPVNTQVLHRTGGAIRDLIGGKKELTRRSMDAASLAILLRTWTNGHDAMVIKEKMSTRPNQNSSKIMKVDGILIGVIAGLGIELVEIDPNKWKLGLGLSADKKKSIEMAIRLFPSWKHMFARVKDHDRAEAVLLGLYGTIPTTRP